MVAEMGGDCSVKYSFYCLFRTIISCEYSWGARSIRSLAYDTGFQAQCGPQQLLFYLIHILFL